LSQFTRRRVERAVRTTGYVQNLVAGSLASSRTHVIAAIVPNIDHPAWGKTVSATAELLRGAGYHLLLGEHSFSTEKEEALIAAFLGRRPDGFLLHGRQHTPRAVKLLRGAGIPIVELGELTGQPLDMVVSYSNYEAGKALTTYLLERGYRRIGMICLQRDLSERHYQRWRGYRAALRGKGHQYADRLTVETTLGYRKGAEGLLALVDRDASLDAVFCTSDVLAAGAQFECLRRGWPVPTRVAVAGFDDQDLAAELVPALTTVHVPREAIGALAGRMLLDRASGKAVAPKRVDVGFRIMGRESA
jgi:LacI family gluconate utilization system Gnt-I transcriptional repressor